MKYQTIIKIEVEAKSEGEAINKIYELMASGDVELRDLEEIE